MTKPPAMARALDRASRAQRKTVRAKMRADIDAMRHEAMTAANVHASQAEAAQQFATAREALLWPLLIALSFGENMAPPVSRRLVQDS